MRNPEIDRLIMNSQGLVRSIAWGIHRKIRAYVELEDLICYGQVGLMEAAQEFDSGQNVKFTTYAYHRIRGSIFDGLNKLSWFKHADYHRGKYLNMATDVLKESSESSNEETGNAEWLQSTATNMAMVYMFSHLASKNESADYEVEDQKEDSTSSTDNSEIYEKLHQVIDKLPEDARSLIKATYFEGCTLKEAGERLGHTKSWASRLHAKALKQIASALVESV